MTTIHIVPNAHLDPAWLWDWREGLNESIATCRTIADLMNENPDLTFTRGEAFFPPTPPEIKTPISVVVVKEETDAHETLFREDGHRGVRRSPAVVLARMRVLSPDG